MTTDLVNQMRRYLDYAATYEMITELTVPPRKVRGAVAAIVSAVCVLALAAPMLLLRNSSPISSVSGATNGPLDIGVEVVWPQSGFEGSAEEVAAEFARIALGWDNALVSSDPQAHPDGPVWTTVQDPDSRELRLLSIPLDSSRRGIVQVGTGRITTGRTESGDTSWIGIPSFDGADYAVLHIRHENSDQVSVLTASAEELSRHKVDVPTDPGMVVSVLIIYGSIDGRILGAEGGTFLGNK